MKWFSGIMAVLLLMLVALVTVSRRETSGAWIAFVSRRDGNAAIHLMTSNGTSAQKVTPDRLCGDSPQWSPDGRFIAFWNYCDQAVQLLRTQRGAAPIESSVSGLLASANIIWSPDSQRIAVTHADVNSYRVVQIDSAGTHPLKDNAYAVAWSPDGEWVYMITQYESRRSLVRFRPQTAEIEPIIIGVRLIPTVSWSPNGEQAAVVVTTLENDEFYLLTAHNEERQRIQPDQLPRYISLPIWSPDGEWILFLGEDEYPNRYIYRVRPNGDDLAPLTSQPGRLWDLQWSPDGEWLLFSGTYGEQEGIFRMRPDLHPDSRPDSSQLEYLSDGRSPHYAPISGREWHPFWLIIAAAIMFLSPFVTKFRP